MPRQVTIILSAEHYDHTSREFKILSEETSPPNSRQQRSKSRVEELNNLADRIMQVLEIMRKDHVILPCMMRGEKHIMIQFRSAQKHLGDTIHSLQGIGVGVLKGTRIDICELTTSIPVPKLVKGQKKKRLYKWSDRMTTEEIFETIDSGSHLTFDYCAMVVVASMIAAIGLVTDSAVSVVASMLVSPLMGPILAVTWGLTMKDSMLIKRGVRNEAVGALMSWLTGLVVGACIGPFFGPANLTVDWATGNLTSFEMISRGSPWSLLGGGMVAIPSGIGVALALTGGGINALVGVAISAALLPPVVNSGLCLSLAVWFSADPAGYNDMGIAYFQYSLWSFLLFVVNFVLIIVLALGVFKIKKLQPDDNEKAGWKRRMSTFGRSSLMSTKMMSGGRGGEDRLLQVDGNRETEEERKREIVNGDNDDNDTRNFLQSPRGQIEMNRKISTGGTHTIQNPAAEM